MLPEKEAKRAMAFAKTLRELNEAAEGIAQLEDDVEFHEQTSRFVEDRYAPTHEQITSWYEQEVEPVLDNVRDALSAELPAEIEDMGDSKVWGSVVETVGSYGPDFQFGELIPSPEEWEEDAYDLSTQGTLEEVADRLEALGVNPFTEEQRRAMRFYADELRKRADIVAKLAEGEPVT